MNTPANGASVEVGVAQGIGAVPAALAGRCRWPAGPLRADTFAVSSCPAVARTGCWFERTVLELDFRATPEPTTAR
jgi:hypothetical protein